MISDVLAEALTEFEHYLAPDYPMYKDKDGIIEPCVLRCRNEMVACLVILNWPYNVPLEEKERLERFWTEKYGEESSRYISSIVFAWTRTGKPID